MRVQIVHDQGNLFRLTIAPGNLLHEQRPISLASVFGDADGALTSQWLDRHENVACPTTLVFVIESLGS